MGGGEGEGGNGIRERGPGGSPSRSQSEARAGWLRGVGRVRSALLASPGLGRASRDRAAAGARAVAEAMPGLRPPLRLRSSRCLA